MLSSEPRAPQGLHASPVLWVIITLSLICVGCGGQLKPAGQWHTVVAGDTVSALTSQYQSELEDVIELNQLIDPSKIQVGQRLFFPRARLIKSFELSQRLMIATLTRASLSSAQEPARGAQRAPISASRRAELETGSPPLSLVRELHWPIATQHINLSSPFGSRGGSMHKGIDLSAPQGTPTRSVLPGVVRHVAFEAKGYGHYVIIDHGRGLESRYAHHHKVHVKPGERLSRGAQIGDVGNTGRSSGPHLHFELRYQGEPLDPLLYLPALP